MSQLSKKNPHGGLWAVEAGLYNETRTRAPLEQTSSSPSQRHRIPFLTQIPKQAKPAGPDRWVFALDFPKSMAIQLFRNSAMYFPASHFADNFKMHVNSAIMKSSHVNRHGICRQAVCEQGRSTETYMSITGNSNLDMQIKKLARLPS